MKKTYEIVLENEKGYKHIEFDNITSSVNYWSKYAKQQEKEGCFVEMQFEYYSDKKETYLVKYESFNRKTRMREKIRIIKNREQLLRLNKK